MRAQTTTWTVAAAPWLYLGIPALMVVALYAPLVPGLVWEWAEFPSLSHGFAIPFIAAYLAWGRRQHLRDVALESSAWGLPLLVLGLGALVVGMQGQEPFLARISLPITLFGLALLLAGGEVVRQMWPALAYLVFMIPLPWATVKMITYRSRLFDAAVSAGVLQWLGVPIHREGVMLQLPNMLLEVADECSSIPAIAALLALGVAYTSLAQRPLAIRVALIAATLPVAILSNIIRITSTAAAVYYVGPWTLGTAYHQFNGTVNFMLTFLMLLALDGLLMRLALRRRP